MFKRPKKFLTLFCLLTAGSLFMNDTKATSRRTIFHVIHEGMTIDKIPETYNWPKAASQKGEIYYGFNHDIKSYHEVILKFSNGKTTTLLKGKDLKTHNRVAPTKKLPISYEGLEIQFKIKNTKNHKETLGWRLCRLSHSMPRPGEADYKDYLQQLSQFWKFDYGGRLIVFDKKRGCTQYFRIRNPQKAEKSESTNDQFYIQKLAREE